MAKAATPKKNPRKRKTPAKALTLRGSKLEDFEPLLPAEEKLRQRAARGEDCEVDDFNGKRPEKVTDDNTVRAAFLRYMILGGCEKSPIHTRGINLNGAFVMCRKDGALGKGLDLEASNIDHDVGLFDCYVDGSIFLLGGSVKGLYLNGSYVDEVNADGLQTKGNVFLHKGFKASGEVRFMGAKLGGDLDCVDGMFEGQEISLQCDGLETKGAVFLNEGFKASGEVRFLNAKLGGDLTCRNGQFSSGLDAQNAHVDKNVWLDDSFVANKTVAFRNATIGGNLHCEGGTFADPNIAFIANRAKIDGNVDFGKAKAAGTIALTGTEIGGDFTPQGAVLEGAPALQLRNSKIGGTLFWRSLGFANGEVDFGGASCTTINMDGQSWMRKRPEYMERKPKNEESEATAKQQADPENGEAETKEPEKKTQFATRLANFTYKGFSELPDGCKANFWIEWLKQQPDDHLGKRFRPRPWAQLAEVLESMGFEEEARDIRIEKQKMQTRFMAHHEPVALDGFNLTHQLQVFWRSFLWGPVVDYGYRPGKALLWLAGLVVIGWFVYFLAAENGVMTPTHPLIYKEARAGGTIPGWCAENWVYFPDESCATAMPSEYSEFFPLIYAADVALPVVNLRMEDDWAPRVVNTIGERDYLGLFVRTWEWFLIAAGWVLSLLFVSAVGGSIRR